MRLKKIYCILGVIGVILSAFGAHALKNILDADHMKTWQTASLYLFIHVLAGLYSEQHSKKNRSSYLFFTGIILFSGSLYALVLTKIRYLGIITPIGGVSFILGWLFLFFDLT